MKPIYLLLPASVTALMLLSTSIHAQAVRFSDVDTDGNGRLSYSELQAAFGTSAADRIWTRNNGTEISRDDIRAINGADDDDDDGRGLDDDDDDDGRDDDDDDGGRDDDDDDGGNDDDDDGGNDDDD